MSDTVWIMVVHGTAIELFAKPKFLAAFDLEVPDEQYGWGSATLVDDPRDAMPFPGLAEVMATWKTQSRTVPIRADGKPNRPLTRYTIDVQRLGDVLEKGVRSWA